MYKAVLYILTLLMMLSISNISATFSFTNQESKTQRKFDDNFKSRYDSETFNYEGANANRNSKTNDSDDKPAEYSSDIPEESTKNNSTVINLGFLTWIFIGIFVLAVVFILYNLIGDGNKSFFNRGKLRKINDYEITAKNIENTDIHTLIQQAESNEDFRLAIRYNYLLLLKTLSIKRLINLEDDKTNNDYANELSQQPFSSTFQYILYVYNYVWYGEFFINKAQYQLAKTNFSNLINKVK